jgi:hypothetical protein
MESEHDDQMMPYGFSQVIPQFDMADANQWLSATPAIHQPLLIPKALLQKPSCKKMDHFPVKLHRLMTDVEKNNETDVVSFADDGRSFTIHKNGGVCQPYLATPRHFPKQKNFDTFH